MSGLEKIRRTRGLSIRIAEGLGLKRQAIYQWHEIPAKYLRKVEKITGIPKEKLRPDLYR